MHWPPISRMSFSYAMDRVAVLLYSNWNFQTLSKALYVACQKGLLEVSKYLINAGVDVNKTNKVLVRFMNQVFLCPE